MTKKDYIKAATIVKNYQANKKPGQLSLNFLENAFVELFLYDNPRFDENRFRQACKG